MVVSPGVLFTDPADYGTRPKTNKSMGEVIDKVKPGIITPKLQSAELAVSTAQDLFESLDATLTDPETPLDPNESHEQAMITGLVGILEFGGYKLTKKDKFTIKREYTGAPGSRLEKLSTIRKYIAKNVTKSGINKGDAEKIPVILEASKDRKEALDRLGRVEGERDLFLQTSLASTGKMGFLGTSLFSKANRRLWRAKRIFDVNKPTKESAVKLLDLLYRKSKCNVFKRPFTSGIITKNSGSSLRRDLDSTVNTINAHIEDLGEKKQISKTRKFLLLHQVQIAYETVDKEYRKPQKPDFDKAKSKIKF